MFDFTSIIIGFSLHMSSWDVLKQTFKLILIFCFFGRIQVRNNCILHISALHNFTVVISLSISHKTDADKIFILEMFDQQLNMELTIFPTNGWCSNDREWRSVPPERWVCQKIKLIVMQECYCRNLLLPNLAPYHVGSHFHQGPQLTMYILCYHVFKEFSIL